MARMKPIVSLKPQKPAPRPENNKHRNPEKSARRESAVHVKTHKSPPPDKKKPSNAERSAYFARREAAKVLQSTLQGDARRRAVGTIKSLVYSPSIRNKKATYALVCQTLKHLSIIKDCLEEANILNSKWKRQTELMYVITYDILFGQEGLLTGDAEKYLMVKKDLLKSVLAKILKRKGVENIEDLVESDVQKPRYVRVNTLKIDTESAIRELSKQHMVQKDDIVPDLLILPPRADLHNHHLVVNGSVFLQGKASSMPALALRPEPGWEVIDACSAPGNKTVHLAALMKGKGKIIACELNKERVKRLQDNVELAGATNVNVMHGDFLKIDSDCPSYSKVRAILLDPSCSGSGTALDRLDHLLPSHTEGHTDNIDIRRLTNLAGFQKKVLEHAFSFPAVERIVYSTCSIHQIENEDVVSSVLDVAASHGFHLETTFPQWPRRGLPTFDGHHHLLRTNLAEDKEGFFIALFVRKGIVDPQVRDWERDAENRSSGKRSKEIRRRKPLHTIAAKMLKVWLHPHFTHKRCRRKAITSTHERCRSEAITSTHYDKGS